MRSYGQYCALARALDIVGDRWTLLILRELFAREARYSDLRDGLPGIATNLLADRLRHLRDAGVIEAREAPPPVRATVYLLTERGRELAPVLGSLLAWGMPLLTEERGEDEFRSQWLMLALRALYGDVDATGLGPLTAVISTEGEPITLEVGDSITVDLGASTSQDPVLIEGDPHAVYLWLAGEHDGSDIHIGGSRGSIDRLRKLTRRIELTASPT